MFVTNFLLEIVFLLEAANMRKYVIPLYRDKHAQHTISQQNNVYEKCIV